MLKKDYNIYLVNRHQRFQETDIIVNETSTTKLYDNNFTVDIKNDDTLYISTQYVYTVIDENGELLPIWSQSQIETDPNVIADKTASGISDWSLYIGNRWTRIVKHFRDQIMGGPYSLQGVLPGLENTVFAHYYIDGFNSISSKFRQW